MSLAQLTSALAVKAAIEECDRLGRDEFLRIYGFGPARKYLLLYEEREYDSKAIAGVAHKYEFPGLGPLTSDMFSGGISKDGAARRLRELGFQIEEIRYLSGTLVEAGPAEAVLTKLTQRKTNW
jgi:5-methylcytosine-specific restriction enzyme A